MGYFPAGASTVVGNSMGYSLEVFICVVAAMVVLRLEMQRRAGDHYADAGGLGGAIGGCKKILVHCAPEVAGVVACLTLAALLRARGDVNGVDAANEEAWEEIKRQWPLLITADTLLAFQAMLRVVVLLSVVLRSNALMPVPLSDEVASLSLFGSLSRCGLLVVSKVYFLDGPLGGNLPGACELATIPLLVALGGFANIKRCPLIAVAVVCGVAWLAFRHHLSLATEAYADEFFLAAHMFETLSACVYLARSLLIGSEDQSAGTSATGFTHVLMAAQSSLATYYFLRAFDAAPELVGSGLPFEVLQTSVTLQLGMYLGAALVFAAERIQDHTSASAEVTEWVPPMHARAMVL